MGLALAGIQAQFSPSLFLYEYFLFSDSKLSESFGRGEINWWMIAFQCGVLWFYFPS